MREQRAVHSVGQQWMPGGALLWLVESTDQHGVNHAYAFPLNALETRAAEYKFDPRSKGDMETVLDVMLHEQFMPDVTNPMNFHTDPAWKSGLRSTATIPMMGMGIGEPVPIHLYNAPSIQVAREALLMRVGEVKERVVMRSAAVVPRSALMGVSAEMSYPRCPLDALRQHPVDMRRYEDRVDQVRTMRASIARGVVPQEMQERPQTYRQYRQNWTERPRTPQDQSMVLQGEAVRKGTEIL